MRRLLLVSSSKTHGTGYLDHCESNVKKQFAGIDSVLFVPYALDDRDGYAAVARERFERMGLGLDSIHEAENPRRAVELADGIFVGGGNTFRLLKTLQDERVLELIRRRALAGMPYMGTSAGSNIAGPTIRTTNDMPIVFPQGFEALRLVPFQLNPHYVDPEPGSTHMGETRDDRLREFHEENETPVVALREGAMLVIDGSLAIVEGASGGKLFRRGQPAEALETGASLDALMD